MGMPISNILRRAAAKALPIALISCGTFVPMTSGADSNAPETVASSSRRWEHEHQAFAGPLLDADWFAKRRVVVYLMPEDGDLKAVRRAAALVMRDRWTEGDWSLKHVIVSDVGRLRFAARRRLAIHEIAIEMTKEAGQEPQFASENEDYVLQNVFFVQDLDRSVWRELLGEKHDERAAAIVLLGYGGKVVRVLNASEAVQPIEAAATGTAGQAEIVVDVRKDLPSQPDLGG
jgi:hypothetical protein